MSPPGEGWQEIANAPRDRQIKLAYYYTPSETAAKHGAVAQWFYSTGLQIYPGCWSGILGSRPSHWREE